MTRPDTADAALRPDMPPVEMQRRDFTAMLAELRRRSQGRREAGAFLLGPRAPSAPRPSLTAAAVPVDVRRPFGGRRVTDVVYYDDLDPDCLTGNIVFSAAGYTALNAWCRTRELRVLADLHLHPRAGVRQSPVDAAHPMVSMRGHLALIAPNFGAGVTCVRQLGAHVLTPPHWVSRYEKDVKEVFVVRTTPGWWWQTLVDKVRILFRHRDIQPDNSRPRAAGPLDESAVEA